MKTILFPSDLFDQESGTYAYLRLFARVWQARVVVLQVFQPIAPDTTLSTFADPGVGSMALLDLEIISQKHLETVVETLRAEGLNAEGDWRMGDVENCLLDASGTYAPDLLITRHSTVATFFDRLVGSAADELARHAFCPVLFIPAQLAEVAPVARPFRSVAYVLQQNITQSTVAEQTDALVAAFDAHLTVITSEEIDDNRPDLFIIQRRETGFLSGLLGTDPTEKLLKTATVPVLVYHEKTV